MKEINITGLRFGKLIVLYQVSPENGAVWMCQCDCGNRVQKKATRLRYVAKKYSGEFVSCGCTHNFKTHGLSHTRIYKIYTGILKRCFQEGCKSYKDYGGRGITVCVEWKNDFLKFRTWALHNGYKDNLTIERSDVNGNYSPDNCTWITKSMQSNNMRTSRFVTFEGQTRTLSEWSKLQNIGHSTLIFRLRSGWSISEALTIKPFKGQNSRDHVYNLIPTSK